MKLFGKVGMLLAVAALAGIATAAVKPPVKNVRAPEIKAPAAATASVSDRAPAGSTKAVKASKKKAVGQSTGTAAYRPASRPKALRPVFGKMDRRATAYSPHQLQKHPQPATSHNRRLHKGKAVLLQHARKPSGIKASYTICNQDFETDWTGWTVVDGNGDTYEWQVGTTSDIGTYTPPNYGTAYAYYCDDDAGSGVVNYNEEWISPAFAVPAVAQLNFQYGWGFQVWQSGERMSALVHTCVSGVWGNWDTLITYGGSGSGTETFDLSAYLPADSIQVKWVYDDYNASSSWGYTCAVDNVVITGVTPENYDVKPQALTTPDPTGWLTPGTPITPAAVAQNSGLDTAFNFEVHLAIDSAGVNIYSAMQTVDTLAPGGTVPVTFTGWTPGPAGHTYDFTLYTVYAQDLDHTNDTLYAHLVTFQEVTSINSPYTTTVPTCDGSIDVATEWADAVKIDMSDVYNMAGTGVYPPGSCFLYVKNDNNNIYFAIDGVHDATYSGGSYDQVGLYFDDNHNGAWEASPDTTEGNIAIGDQNGYGIESRWITTGPTFGSWTIRTGLFPVGYGNGSGHEQYEAAVPISSVCDPAKVGALPGMSFGFWTFALDVDANVQYGWWPQSNATWNDPAGYGTITLGTSGLPDAALMAIEAPAGVYAPNASVNPVAKVGNLGPAAADFAVHCVIDTNGTPLYTDVQSVTGLASLDTLQVTFTQWNIPDIQGTFHVTMYVTYGSDTNPANDTLASQIFTFVETSDVSSPFTTVVPTCDGSIDTVAEWKDAAKVDISDVYNTGGTGSYAPGSVMMYIKNDNTHIYVAVDNTVDATAGTGYDQMGLYFDDNHNGVWEDSPDTTEGNNTIGDFGGLGIYTRWITSGPSYGNWTPRTGLYPVGYGTASGHEQFEAAIPLGSQTDPGQINTMPGSTVGLYAMCTDDDASTQPGYWPQSNPAWNDPAGYGAVKLGTSGAPDVAMTAIRVPTGTVLPGGNVIPMAKVTNFSPGNASFTVTAQIDTNGTVVYSDVQNVTDLVSLDTLDVSFAQWNILAQPANYNVTMYVTYGGDTNPANDTLRSTVAGSWVGWHPEDVTGTTDVQWAQSCTDGQNLWVIGGLAAGSTLSAAVQRYTPGVGWSTSTDIPTSSIGGACAMIGGKIYVIGGFDASFSVVNRTAIFDTATGVWSTGTAPIDARGGLGGGMVGGKMYLVGGANSGSFPTDCPTYCYDPAADTAGGAPWTTLTACPRGTLILGSAFMPSNASNYVFIAGDYRGNSGYDAYRYEPAADTAGGAPWTALATTPTDIGGMWSEIVHDGTYLYVTGGDPAGVWTAPYSDQTYTWDEVNGWVNLGIAMSSAREPSAGGIIGNKLYTFGGTTGSGPIDPPPFEWTYLKTYTGVAGRPVSIPAPATFALRPNYPNPAVGRTTICYQLPVRAGTTLTIYNIAGQKVKTLASGVQEAGIHQVSWNCDNDAGRKVSAGVYLYRLQSGQSQATKKITVLR